MRDLRDLFVNQDRDVAEKTIRDGTRSEYLGQNRVLCSILDGRKFFAVADDVGFSTHMIFDGYWEFWLSKCFAQYIEPGDVVVDVGANLGYYTILAAELVGSHGRVISIEPNPEIFRFLCDSVNVNGFAGRVDLFNVAVNYEPDKSTKAFFCPHGEPKNGRFVDEIESVEKLRNVGKVFEVNTVSAVPDIGDRLDFVKIDVEGAELVVLEALADDIAKFKPKVVCEVNFGRGYGYEEVSQAICAQGELAHLDYDGTVKPLTKRMAETERLNDDWLVCENF